MYVCMSVCMYVCMLWEAACTRAKLNFANLVPAQDFGVYVCMCVCVYVCVGFGSATAFQNKRSFL